MSMCLKLICKMSKLDSTEKSIAISISRLKYDLSEICGQKCDFNYVQYQEKISAICKKASEIPHSY